MKRSSLIVRSGHCRLAQAALGIIALWIAGGHHRAGADDTGIPAPAREFRAAWVATVANIDWPSRRTLTSQQQQEELIAILDCAARLNLNAVIFQVRPHCDALYASELEPWSEYLTGAMGKPPEPLYDPLEVAVREAHRRGLELHAWFNPYRASHPVGSSEFPANHISNTHPEIVRKYGKYLWLDPGEPAAAAHSLAVIVDVVRRYDVDGIHFDDYFYPYPVHDEQDQRVDFPDEPSWRKVEDGGETLSRVDWRRQNVNRFIERVQGEIKREKPWVKFGVSPFGIWRLGHPKSVKGFDAYASLYADSRKWLRKGWLDYVSPQLYWEVESEGQSYPVLLRWWHKQNTRGRHLWPGNFTSRVANPDSGNWPVEEITRQIELTRQQDGATGNIHFSMKALRDESRGMGAALAEGPYREPALVPATTWLEAKAPPQPDADIRGAKLQLRSANQDSPWLWVVQADTAEGWTTKILPGHVAECDVVGQTAVGAPRRIAVSTVNRLGHLSPAQVLRP